MCLHPAGNTTTSSSATTFPAASIGTGTGMVNGVPTDWNDISAVTGNMCTSKGKDEDYDYACVLGASFLFYEAQRSGKLPSSGRRIKWRGDSSLKDVSPNGHDLIGGLYDAGDFVKFMLPYGWSVTVLAWGLVAFPEGYQKSQQSFHALSTLRWAADFIIKCHVDDTVFVAQVGNGTADHLLWRRAEDIQEPAKVRAALRALACVSSCCETGAVAWPGWLASRAASVHASLLPSALLPRPLPKPKPSPTAPPPAGVCGGREGPGI
jgi:hypothetical protein